ncbi:hypothetical protein A6C57_24320 [Fibrella sp. ES10-3-2-2]|nr:hypothetical protein A6C57_24320 [Fibrella sp. ES10-3-2-2]
MTNTLLESNELPDWFTYPEAAKLLVSKNLIDLQPWLILTGEHLRLCDNYYLNCGVVPYAIRLDNDDIIGWSQKHNGKLARFDRTGLAFGLDQIYNDLWEWLQAAVNDVADFHADLTA